ncbi:MAG: WYL domain-containing transcriptional regulator [bacterium]
MSRFLRVARLIELISVIRHHPDWGPKKLAEYFEISEKRVYDDLSELNAANIPIVYNGKGYSFLSTASLPPVHFTIDEALALLMGSKMIQSQSDGYYSHGARSATAKMLNLLPENIRGYFIDLDEKISVSTKGFSEINHALKFLNEAIVSRDTITTLYYSFSSDEKRERDIEPYAVVFRGNAWYLVGRCHLRGEVRTFRLNRMEDIRKGSGKFEYPYDFSITDYLEKSWGIFQGEETEVRVKFSPRIAPLIEEHQWQPQQGIEKRGDGSIIFTAVVKGTFEIRRWILGWGEDAEVLAPEGLREEIKSIASTIANR